MSRFVSRTPQGRHAADFWRRPTAENPRPPEIGAATAIRLLPDGTFEAAAETSRRGGGSAMVVDPG
jgi:hypothetical protein